MKCGAEAQTRKNKLPCGRGRLDGGLFLVLIDADPAPWPDRNRRTIPTVVR
jgi:hypothetical protein